MSRVELPGGVCATEREALAALVAEAKRQGVSYGNIFNAEIRPFPRTGKAAGKTICE